VSTNSPLIARIPDCPLDIIGDVHGEYDALEKLLQQLGYDQEGVSPDDRKLVFLGDLVDRGPNSPAVVDKVMDLINKERAYCLMGNHELNILLNKQLPGNGWFIQPNAAETAGEFHSSPVDPSRIDDYRRFFASLPIVLEHKSLRLVHACWHGPSVARLRSDAGSNSPVTALYAQYEGEVDKKRNSAELAHMVEQERNFYAVSLEDPDWVAELLPAHAEAEVIGQMSNPIRVLSSGAVHAANEPFFAMGQWRMIYRTRWWDSYYDDIPVIIGHFWRRFDDAAERISGVFGRDVFEGISSHAWMGPRKNVYCVDYSVGQRHAERRREPGHDKFHGKLAALRYPEWEVHHDDGTVIPLD